jgi:hypothetical protein
MRTLRLVSLMALVTVCVAACRAAEAPQSILVIGWDGAQRAHVQEMLAQHELPTLALLASQGIMADVDVTSGATDTKAGWTQILTGYKPEKTGVYNNSVFGPIPEGYSVFERLERFFGPDNIVTMAIVGKRGHVDNDPEQKIPYDRWLQRQEREKRLERKHPGQSQLQGGQIIEEHGQKYVLLHAKPWYNASRHMDLFHNGLLQNDRVGTMAMEKLEANKDKRLFFFIHFAEPDHSGHRYGENSQEYTDALKDDDLWTGRIIEKLRDLDLYRKTLIYVTADHGFDEGAYGHSYAPYIFVATNDNAFAREQGRREDIAATVLRRFGMDFSTITPALDGIPFDEPAPERRAAPTAPAKIRRRDAPRPTEATPPEV